MSIALSVLAILCVILTIGATAAIGDIYSSDAAGRGMAAVFAMGIGIVLWILLGVFVAVAKAKGAFSALPGWALSLIVIALAAGCLEAMVLITKIGEHSLFLTSLQFFVAAGSILVIAYGLFDIFGGIPQQHSTLIGLIACVLACMLAVAPWIEAVPAMADKQARDAAMYEAWVQRQAAEEQRKSELQAIHDSGSMEQFLEFVEVPPDWSGEIRSIATERIRNLPDKQEQAERLLKQQDLRVVLIEGDLELNVTPALIDGTKSCFRKLADRYRPAGADASFDSISDALSQYLSALEWLNEHGHTPGEELDMLTAMAMQYPETGSRILFLARLDYYRKPLDSSSR